MSCFCLVSAHQLLARQVLERAHERERLLAHLEVAVLDELGDERHRLGHVRERALLERRVEPREPEEVVKTK